MTTYDADAIRRTAAILPLLPVDASPRKAGPDSWRARCPFHQGKDRNLSVRRTDGVWTYRCFVCHESGDAIKFLRMLEGATFAEACERLGGKPADGPPPQMHRPPWILLCDGRGCGRTVDVETADIPYIGILAHPTWLMLADGRAYCWRCCWAAFARRKHERPARG